VRIPVDTMEPGRKYRLELQFKETGTTIWAVATYVSPEPDDREKLRLDIRPQRGVHPVRKTDIRAVFGVLQSVPHEWVAPS
jgi:hypothetical protein